MGLCAALLFKGLCKLLPRQEKFCCFAGGLLTAVLNTVFFMGALVLLFYNLPYVQDAAQSMGATNALMFVVLFVGVQAIGEWVTCCLVAGSRRPAGAQIPQTELKIRVPGRCGPELFLWILRGRYGRIKEKGRSNPL